jgi:hypothetical protein
MMEHVAGQRRRERAAFHVVTVLPFIREGHEKQPS